MKKIKNNKIIVLMFSLCLIILVIGFSYAFFIYNKTGLYIHTINGGKMKVIYDETTGNNITIENAYPLTDEEALTKSLEFEFTITGYNESDKNVYYAIEMDYGEDISGKNRFKDTDMKLTLYENDKEVFENEIFSNLDNQDIYYNYFKSGTSSQSPTINNYKMKIWINDYVIISDTIENNISLWDEMDYRLLKDKLSTKDLTRIENNEVTTLEELGISVYTSDEFANSYANFKVNVRADLTYDDFGYITYDANGGTNAPKKTSVLTGMVTRNSPFKTATVNGQTVYSTCIGWSSDPNAEVPEYKSGDYYNGEGEVLFAVYSSDINVMTDLNQFNTYKPQITEVYFINEKEENIDARYNASSIKYDLTKNNQGRVLGWLENDYYDEATSTQYYKLYIGSEGTTYLSTGNYLFSNSSSRYRFSNMTNISLENANTSLVTDMSSMFRDCSSITTLGVSKFDTSNVTDVSYMFLDCSSLTTLDVSNFDTSNVTSMSMMFYSCNSLTTLDLSNFDTSNITNMYSMFFYCSSLTTLDVSNFDTSSVTDMLYMFYNCSSLTELDVSNFDTSNVTTMYSMFRSCSSLTTLDVSNFDTSNVTNMSYMFNNCSSLTSLDVSNFDTSNAITMSGMFYNCSSLTTLDVSDFYTSKVTDMSSMFNGCTSLTTLDVSKFDTSDVTTMYCMFDGCLSLTELDISKFDTSNVTSMVYMFNGCTSLTTLDVSKFDTSNVTNMVYMFSNCSSLTTLDVSKFDTSKVTDMSDMFYNCSSLTELDISKFDTSNITSMDTMFNNCSKLITLDVSKFDTSNVKSMLKMFSNCSSLTTLDVSKFDTSNVTDMSEMFRSCSKLTMLDVSNFDTSNVTNMSLMFQICSKLTTLDVSNFDTSNVTNMSAMFHSCSKLTTIYSNSDWNIGKVTSSTDMFFGCGKLVGAVPYNLSKIDVTMANPDIGYFTRKTV